MKNPLKNMFAWANKYDKLSDAEVERMGNKARIFGGLEGGVYDRQYVIGELLKRDEMNGSKLAVLIALISLALSILIFPVSFYLNLRQIKDLMQNESTRNIDYILSFDKRLSEDKNSEMADVIEEGKPLLVENGGKYSTHDLDNFLGIYNQLNDVRDYDLVDDELIANNFSDGLVQAYNNLEIKNYLSKIRQQDESYFAGFDELAELYIK